MRKEKMEEKIKDEKIEKVKRRFEQRQELKEIVEEDKELLKKLE